MQKDHNFNQSFINSFRSKPNSDPDSSTYIYIYIYRERERESLHGEYVRWVWADLREAAPREREREREREMGTKIMVKAVNGFI